MLLRIAQWLCRKQIQSLEEHNYAIYERREQLEKENAELKLEVRIARMYANDDEAVDELLTAYEQRQKEIALREARMQQQRAHNYAANQQQVVGHHRAWRPEYLGSVVGLVK